MAAMMIPLFDGPEREAALRELARVRMRSYCAGLGLDFEAVWGEVEARFAWGKTQPFVYSIEMACNFVRNRLAFADEG